MTNAKSEDAEEERGGHVKLWAVSLLVSVVLFMVALRLMGPPPPEHLVLAAGAKDGAYYARAQQYAERLGRDGIDVEVRATAGSIENLRLLREGKADVAFVQGGTASADDRESLRTIASVFFEPLWIFHRRDRPLDGLASLRGSRIAAGVDGSGTRVLAAELLQATGAVSVDGEGPAATVLDMGGSGAVTALQANDADVAIFVVGADAAYLRPLLLSEEFALLPLPRLDALVRRRRYLADVHVPRGLFDLVRDVPSADMHLLAPTAALVGREDLHAAVAPLFIEAARTVHAAGSLLAAPDRFPSPDHVDVPLSIAARRYFDQGPSWLYRVFPFWIASFLDRAIFLLLPLLTILFPLFKTAPPLYRWRIRRRIYRWYRGIRSADRKTREESPRAVLRTELQQLERIEQEVANVSIPLSYMEEFYNLRLHLDFVMRRVRERLMKQGTESQ